MISIISINLKYNLIKVWICLVLNFVNKANKCGKYHNSLKFTTHVSINSREDDPEVITGALGKHSSEDRTLCVVQHRQGIPVADISRGLGVTR